jgi:hypothetical protein
MDVHDDASSIEQSVDDACRIGAVEASVVVSQPS